MGAPLTAVPTPARTVLVGLTTATLAVEIVVAVIVVILLVAILVLNHRKRSRAKGGSWQPAPQRDDADPQQPAPVAAGASASQPGFGATEQAGTIATTVSADPVTPPAPGTPAAWLPDPSGVPDTLRYWDGAAWTQHVAQRT